MEYPLLPQQMPEQIKKVWYQSNIIGLALLWGVGLLIGGVLLWFDRLNSFLLMGLFAYGGVVFICFLLAMAFVPYRYQFHRYEVTEKDLAFQKGYLFRSITYVPIKRIQHIETEQGPLLRQADLMEIVIHTAATSHRIAGLTVVEALALRNQIIELVKVAKEDV
ncbi:MAG: PH domain-containing protein [Enterococcus sp.]